MNKLLIANQQVNEKLRTLCSQFHTYLDPRWLTSDICKTKYMPGYHDALEEFNNAVREYERLKQYSLEADRSLTVCQMKKDIAAANPKEEKLVAVTICPEDGQLITCQSLIEIMKSVTAIHSMDYVFEQRSKPGEVPHGWHIHANVHTLAAPSKIRQFISQKLNSRGYSYFIKCLKADENWKNKYMSGIKGSPDKDEKVLQDRIIRKELGISDMLIFTRS